MLHKLYLWIDVYTLFNYQRDRSETQETKMKLLTLGKLLDEKIGMISPLAQKVSELKTSSVLIGDYDLKLSRQEYYMAKQDQVNCILN